VSPNIINSAGGSAIVNAMRYDWSFGEITLINTFSTSKLIVTQGVLQTRLDTAGTGINDIPVPIPDITVFPNPARNSVFLKADYPYSCNLHYTLTDVQGKIIQEKQVAVAKGDDQQTLDLSGLAAGTYLLNMQIVRDNTTYSKTARIQKNN
jgi:hypothetical protein